ncbi:MAG: hypothetical protein IJI36_07845 [Kiritimatiellae bacterium]|nr:hypothetical protein [Kiritimatiellia bacterium]
MGKTRKDAWGESLPEDVRWQLYAYTKPPTDEEKSAGRPWLRNFRTDVLPYLSLQGIVAPSEAGWYRFLGRMREAEAAKTIIRVETSKRIAEGMTAAKIDPRLAADVMTSLAVDEAAKPPDERNEKVMGIFASAAALFTASAQRAQELELKQAAQATRDEQLRLAREKFEAAERRESAAKSALDDKKLTDADKIAKMKEIFG